MSVETRNKIAPPILFDHTEVGRLSQQINMIVLIWLDLNIFGHDEV
jgi:hypothetical protein